MTSYKTVRFLDFKALLYTLVLYIVCLCVLFDQREETIGSHLMVKVFVSNRG